MIVNRETIERDIEKGSPLPVTFEWKERTDGGKALIVTVPVQTEAGIPQILMAFPPQMPPAFIPKAVARAKALIDEVFDANMVGLVFQGAAQRKPSLLVPKGIAIPKKLVG